MWRHVFWVPIILWAVGCGQARPYSAQDLRDVKSVYSVLLPVYRDFKSAFLASDGSRMSDDMRRERAICARVDVIDRRDTIDPNVDLFQASAALDTFCNDMESGYAAWRKAHHLPYDHSISPSLPASAFKDGDLAILKMPGYLRHPSALT